MPRSLDQFVDEESYVGSSAGGGGRGHVTMGGATMEAGRGESERRPLRCRRLLRPLYLQPWDAGVNVAAICGKMVGI